MNDQFFIEYIIGVLSVLGDLFFTILAYVGVPAIIVSLNRNIGKKGLLILIIVNAIFFFAMFNILQYIFLDGKLEEIKITPAVLWSLAAYNILLRTIKKREAQKIFSETQEEKSACTTQPNSPPNGVTDANVKNPVEHLYMNPPSNAGAQFSECSPSEGNTCRVSKKKTTRKVIIFCKNCGAEVKKSDKACPVCGTRLKILWQPILKNPFLSYYVYPWL